MNSPAPVFKKTREHYLNALADVKMDAVSDRLGMRQGPDGTAVRLFGSMFTFTGTELVDDTGRPAAFDTLVVISRYITMCPRQASLDREWTAYRDFKDSGPLLKYVADNVEGAVARAFSGRVAALEAAAAALGGEAAEEALAYDLIRRFSALPRIDMLLLFNDADELFPAECHVLFERRTEEYLDMECVAILGAMLAEALRRQG